MTYDPSWSNLAKVVYLRTYSRKDKGHRENFSETVERVLAGNIRGFNVSEHEQQRLRYFLSERKAGPAGRGWWFSGAPTHELIGSAATANCWFVTLDKVEHFVHAQDLLMLGGGVGFSCEHQFVSKLPRVKKGVQIVHRPSNDADFIIPDSREGWNEFTRRMLEAYFVTGRSFSFSTVCVRPAGEPIKGFGGVAGGPGPLIDFAEDVNKILQAREGRRMRPIDASDLMCAIGEMVVSGNTRRSALLSLGDAWDKEFLTAKRWDLGTLPRYRSRANYSVVCDDVEDLHPAFWRSYEHGEAFGIVNRKNIQSYGRMGELKADTAIGVNPCVVGSTLVAVADGRLHVPIQQLAEEGKDVPVLTLGSEGQICVRYMRNPRVTGENVPVVKVTLDSGDSFVVTKDHKFLSNDNGYVEAQHLQPGESLRVVNRRQTPLGHSPKLYWTMFDRAADKDVYEHRIIAQFAMNTNQDDLGPDDVVHHKNHNSLDNSWDNLERISRSAHSTEHSADAQRGDSNMNFSGFTHDALLFAARNLTVSLGRRASIGEWEAYAAERGLPTKFSGWRLHHLGSMLGMLKFAAMEQGYESVDADPRQVRALMEALQEGYNARIEDGVIVYQKSCEVCDATIRSGRKGTKYCSRTCQNLARSEEIRQAASRSLRETNDKKHEELRAKQAQVWIDSYKLLGRLPKKAEWAKECKEAGVSCEISRVSSPFRSYADLVKFAENYNHKVVSVEDAGTATVYNGTVDDFSNFFVGGFESSPEKFSYFNNLNCAEATLENLESCNLQSLAMPRLNGIEEFEEAARLMHRWGKRVAAGNWHIPEVQEVVRRNNRIGTSLTGCLNSPLFNKADLDRAYAAIQDENVKYSAELGIAPSIRTTTMNPSGTLGKFFDMQQCEGAHAPYSRYIIQRVRFAASDPLIPLLAAAGHHMEPERRLDGTLDLGTLVVDFYEAAPEGVVVSDDGSWDMNAQLENVKFVQRHWADQSVSVTVYYRRAHLEEVKAWLRDNLSEIKTISFLEHSEHGYVQAPKEAIRKDTYLSALRKLKPLDIDHFGREEVDGVDGTLLSSMECAGGHCPIR